MLRFTWDPDKAVENEKKHDIRFSEGVSYRGRLVVVAHAEAEDSIRIISARLATNAERRSYER